MIRPLRDYEDSYGQLTFVKCLLYVGIVLTLQASYGMFIVTI